MKRIVIFCDGTWNRSDARFQTNVVRLAQAVCRKAKDGVAQLVLYLEGVGAGRGSNEFAKRIDRIGGGAFGWGLTENIVEAYRHLAFNYETGDEIFIFGFSRGAYTARSLAGLIRSCGIPSVENIPKIPEAIDLYRQRNDATHPATDRSKQFRGWFSPLVATQAGEPEWRREKGLPDCVPIHIRYLGIWDTVGALGVPAQYKLLAQVFNRKHEFHDAKLTSLVRAARHAVAIDERRRTFEPTLWENVDRLNLEAEDEIAVGLREADERRPYRQEWIPGDHGSVGGGGDVRGLANAALDWIAEGAEGAGLRFADGVLDEYRSGTDVAAALRCRSAPPNWFDKLLAMSAADRDGPTAVANVSDVARRRWALASEPLYRPKTLARVAAQLDASESSRSGGG